MKCTSSFFSPSEYPLNLSASPPENFNLHICEASVIFLEDRINDSNRQMNLEVDTFLSTKLQGTVSRLIGRKFIWKVSDHPAQHAFHFSSEGKNL